MVQDWNSIGRRTSSINDDIVDDLE